MLILRFIHSEDTLFVGEEKFKATCVVRNELNGWRKDNQIIETFPSSGERKPYYPRKFPTGLWEVKTPIYTDDPDFAPVKIPTSAVRKILTWDVSSGRYRMVDGHQDDSFYHLHYASNSNTTLGCIRLDSAEDAVDIANLVMYHLLRNTEVWIEVIAGR